MKKAWLIVALAAMVGTAIRTYADVQNIRLSGDIRIRGYYTVNTDGDSVEDQVETTDSYIAQRTRVTVEADLEDHVLVVVTLKAEGLWGVGDENNDRDDDDDDGEVSSGGSTAGAGDIENDRINRLWDVGLTEAYVQFNEMFYTAATLKLGRQYLHYGRGLIFSSIEQEYNYDAARLVLDFYPLTLDLVYATLIENTPFGGNRGQLDRDFGTAPNDAHLVFVNARYEMTDSAIKSVEAYFGWVINSRGGDEGADGISGDPLSSASRVPPSFSGASPLLVGARADLNLTENLETWIEGAYEWGPDGTFSSDSISAWIANVGARFTFKDVEWKPAINANFIYASGGGSDGENFFRPWFDYMEGYNGYLFSPILSNIMIFNLGVTVVPAENTTLSIQGYYYRQVDTTPGGGGAGLLGNPNLDNGGLGYSPTISSHELGWEMDGILGYDYSKDVRFQLVYAAYIPENAYQFFGSNKVAHEVRGEVNVRF